MATESTSADFTHASLFIRLNKEGEQRELAWTEFHNLYAPVITGFARRLGAKPQDVDDLVQDVLNGFFRVSPEFVYNPVAGRFRGYLKTCVCRKLSEFRRKRGREITSVARGDFKDPDDVAVETVWNDVWETEKLGRALAMVRQRYSTNAERQRTFRAFEMCTLLERPPEQVAAELGLSHESVRNAKSRVSRALREEFDRMDDITA
jgi:RNA polymerase sigma factor (sigma-70 family)